MSWKTTINEIEHVPQKIQELKSAVRSSEIPPEDVVSFLKEQNNVGTAVWQGFCRESLNLLEQHLIHYEDFTHFRFPDEEPLEVVSEGLDEFKDEKKSLPGKESVDSTATFFALNQTEKIKWLERCFKPGVCSDLFQSTYKELLQKESQPFVLCFILKNLHLLLKENTSRQESVKILLHFSNSKDEDIRYAVLEGLQIHMTGEITADKQIVEHLLKNSLRDSARRIQQLTGTMLSIHYREKTLKYLKNWMKKADPEKELLGFKIFFKDFPELQSVYDALKPVQKTITPVIPKEEEEEEKELLQDRLTREVKELDSRHGFRISLVFNVILLLAAAVGFFTGGSDSSPQSSALLDQLRQEQNALQSKLNQEQTELKNLDDEYFQFVQAMDAVVMYYTTEKQNDAVEAFSQLKKYQDQFPEGKQYAKKLISSYESKMREQNPELVFHELMKSSEEVISGAGNAEVLLDRVQNFSIKFPEYKILERKKLEEKIRALLPEAKVEANLLGSFENAMKQGRVEDAYGVLKTLREKFPKKQFFNEEERAAKLALGDSLSPLYQIIEQLLAQRNYYGDDKAPYYLLKWFLVYQKLGWEASAKEKWRLFSGVANLNQLSESPEWLAMVGKLFQDRFKEKFLWLKKMVEAENKSDYRFQVPHLCARLAFYSATGLYTNYVDTLASFPWNNLVNPGDRIVVLDAIRKTLYELPDTNRLAVGRVLKQWKFNSEVYNLLNQGKYSTPNPPIDAPSILEAFKASITLGLTESAIKIAKSYLDGKKQAESQLLADAAALFDKTDLEFGQSLFQLSRFRSEETRLRSIASQWYGERKENYLASRYYYGIQFNLLSVSQLESQFELLKNDSLLHSSSIAKLGACLSLLQNLKARTKQSGSDVLEAAIKLLPTIVDTETNLREVKKSFLIDAVALGSVQRSSEVYTQYLEYKEGFGGAFLGDMDDNDLVILNAYMAACSGNLPKAAQALSVTPDSLGTLHLSALMDMGFASAFRAASILSDSVSGFSDSFVNYSIFEPQQTRVK